MKTVRLEKLSLVTALLVVLGALFIFAHANAGPWTAPVLDDDDMHVVARPGQLSPGASGLATSPPAAGPVAPRGPTTTGGRGFTVSTGAPQLASPKLADLTGDGVPEILMTTYGITNPYGEGWLHVWDGAGNPLTGFPILMTGAAPATAAVGDLDGDGTCEIVQGTWNNLYVFNADGSPYPGWPRSMTVYHAAALYDLDGDDDLEIIVAAKNKLEVFHHDGTSLAGFPVTHSTNLTAPALADLDGDGDREIVCGSYVASGSTTDYVLAWHHDGVPATGFPATCAGSVKAAPAAADLDGDGDFEIIADCWNKNGTDELYVFDGQGQLMPGWPLAVPYIRLSSPSVADLDLDGDLEIIVGGWHQNPYSEEVQAFHHDGSTVAGFPVNLNNSPSGNVNSTPVTGDIDGDGYPEIVVKAVNNIYALNHDGSPVAGFPHFLDDTSHSGTTSPTPALGDPDGDGQLELFAAACFDLCALIDVTGPAASGALCWPVYRHDPRNLGIHGADAEPLVADKDEISETTGDVVKLSLDAGKSEAGRLYILFSGVSGSSPGLNLPGGLALLPLNWDGFTNLALVLINTPAFKAFAGYLDGQGRGTATFDTLGPLPPGHGGIDLHLRLRPEQALELRLQRAVRHRGPLMTLRAGISRVVTSRSGRVRLPGEMTRPARFISTFARILPM